MQRTRRGVLGSVAGVGLAGIAGCLGVEGVEYPDGEPADDAESEAVDEGPNSELADATRAVVDDTLWFATEYIDATTAYIDAIGRVIDEIDTIRETVRTEDRVESEMADRLETLGFEAADRAAEALEPHFSPRDRIEWRIERHVSVLRVFIPREDLDRVIEELDRMEASLGSIGNRLYVDEAFSRAPIHNRLLERWLLPPRVSDDHDETLETTLVEIGVGDSFATSARLPYDEEELDDDEIPRILGSPLESNRRLDRDYRRELRARLGPARQPDGRTGELFFIFSERPEPGDDDEVWIHDLGGPAVYVQRYRDAETAGQRLEAALEAGRTEDSEPIDPRVDRTDGPEAATQWQRYFHYEARGERYAFDEHAGVQYGYLVQAGEFLLAAGFSGDAWEERVGWQGTLEDSWAVI